MIYLGDFYTFIRYISAFQILSIPNKIFLIRNMSINNCNDTFIINIFRFETIYYKCND